MEPAGTLERGLAVLRVLATGPRRPMRATDLVRATGLARSTVDRIVATLVRLGYARAEERDVLLTPRLMELGEAYLACGGLGATLDGYAERLADELDESVSLAVRDGDGVRFVGRFARRRTMSVAFRVGDLLPADRCAAGLILLDPAARWAEDDQLAEPGLVAVAVPVRDASGTAVCALTVASHTSRHTAAGLRDHALPSLLKTAGKMEAALAEPVAPRNPVLSGEPVAPRDPVASRDRAASGEWVPPSHPAASGEPVMSRDPVVSGEQVPVPPSAASGEQFRRSLPVASAGRGSSLPIVAGVDASRATKEELGAGYLQSLARGLAVLVSLGSARGGLTLAASAKVTGLPRATVRRAVQTLERLGYAAADGSRFVLLPKVLEFGYAHLSGRTFGEIVQPHLVDLVARVHESASVAMLSGDDVVYVARVPTVAIMSVDITVGTRFPAYATSMGRVLLADLPAERLAGMPSPPLTPHTLTSPADLAAAVRQAAVDGYALVDQELEEGVRSIAVPIRDRSGRVVAAVNVATHASRASPAELLRDVLPALTETAAHMEADLAHTRMA